MYFFYFLYKIPKNIYKDRSRTGLGTDLYTVLGPSNGPVQSSPGQKTGLLDRDRTGPDRSISTHMHNTNDDILINYRPDSLQESNYIADIEAIIENGAYHSDEVSETDNKKTQEEVSRHIRPKNKNESDHHIIRVYDKPWRSRRVSKWLFYMFIFIILLMVSLLYS